MALQDSDNLIVGRGETPFKTTYSEIKDDIKTQGDAAYLSKVNADTAEGRITFEDGFESNNFDAAYPNFIKASPSSSRAAPAVNLYNRFTHEEAGSKDINSSRIIINQTHFDQNVQFAFKQDCEFSLNYAGCSDLNNITVDPGKTLTISGFRTEVASSSTPGIETYSFYAQGDAPSYFGGPTEHKSGVRVTGGSSTSIGSQGVYSNGNTIALEGTDIALLKSAGVHTLVADEVGRVHKPMDIITNRASSYINEYSKEMVGYLTLNRIGSNPGDPIDDDSAALGYVSNLSSNVEIGGIYHYSTRFSDTGAKVDKLFGYHSSINDRSTYTDVTDAYAFYGAGSAPSYFGGPTEHKSGVRVTGGTKENIKTGFIADSNSAVGLVTVVGDLSRTSGIVYAQRTEIDDASCTGGFDSIVVYDSALASNLDKIFVSFATGAQNLTGTVPNYVGFEVVSGGSSNVENSVGFKSDVELNGALERYNFYAKGNAPNYFKGNIDCDGLINGAFSLRMETDNPAAFQTTYSIDEEGNQVENQTYTGTTEDLLGIIKDLRARIEELESNTLQPLYSTLADLPDASEHHGKTAHVHSEGALYFAHAGNWVKLQNA